MVRIKEKFFEEKLPSGLRCVYVPNKHSPTVCALFMVNVGGLNEYKQKELMGMSHFLEHMMFKGTKRRPNSLIVNQEIDNIGGIYNAFTTKDITVYHIKVPPQQLLKALDLLIDMVFNSILRKKDMEVEKKIILEELHQSLDQPDHIISLGSSLINDGTDLEQNVIGVASSIKKFTHQNLVNYKHKYYTFDNMVFSISGNFNKKTISNFLKKQLKNIKQKKKTLLKLGKKEAYTIYQTFPELKLNKYKCSNKINLIVEKKDSYAQTQVFIGFPIPGINHKLWFHFIFLGYLLGFGFSSRLFLSVREKHGLCYNISAGTNNYRENNGEFIINTGIKQGSLKKVLNLIMKEIKNLKTKKISKKEMSRVFNNMRNKYLLRYEDSENFAEYYAVESLYKKKIRPFHNVIDDILSDKSPINAKVLQEICKKYFVFEKMNIVIAGKIEPENIKKIIENLS